MVISSSPYPNSAIGEQWVSRSFPGAYSLPRKSHKTSQPAPVVQTIKHWVKEESKVWNYDGLVFMLRGRTQPGQTQRFMGFSRHSCPGHSLLWKPGKRSATWWFSILVSRRHTGTVGNGYWTYPSKSETRTAGGIAMRLLFDQGTPVPLRNQLTNHIVETVYEKGWNNTNNWDLLTLAEINNFDALITTDQNLRYQQNLPARKISIVVLLTTSWPRIKNHIAPVIETIDTLNSGSYVEIPIP